jgi:hypothetical protein
MSTPLLNVRPISAELTFPACFDHLKTAGSYHVATSTSAAMYMEAALFQVYVESTKIHLSGTNRCKSKQNISFSHTCLSLQCVFYIHHSLGTSCSLIIVVLTHDGASQLSYLRSIQSLATPSQSLQRSRASIDYCHSSHAT